MLSEPNSPPEPPSDLGMATGDLDYRDRDEVLHPGRGEEPDKTTEDEPDHDEEQHNDSS